MGSMMMDADNMLRTAMLAGNAVDRSLQLALGRYPVPFAHLVHLIHLAHRLTARRTGVNSSIDVGCCCAMIQLCTLSDSSSGESLKEMPRAVHPARTSHVIRAALRLVRSLGVGIPGVVLELVGCVTLSVRVKPGTSRGVAVLDMSAFWAELTP
jgi:hypothetical protein